MTYNALDGVMRAKNITFVHFKEQCNRAYRDYAIATNKRNDDGQHQVFFTSISLIDVNNGSKVFIHRPNINKINPSDCIDMDCDGLKKNILTDTDGSFLGAPGSVISQSEFEWGSQQRGLGDFRIPKEALADENGRMRNISEVYQYRGIVRDESKCTYIDSWQAYECTRMDYRILVIESMDVDTETRRLSPVAIFSDDNKYVDLINGPQDHGWCFGYTCQKRVSTFFAVVTPNKNYDIYLTSTPPTQLRFRIIGADSSFKIRLSMYYSTSNRIDLYKNGAFVAPTNAAYTNGNMILIDPNITNINNLMPTYSSPSGTNLYYKQDRKIYFSIVGADYIDLIRTTVIHVKFGVPAITDDEFFNTDILVQNFAELLGVPASKIRRVQIIREDTRRRRSTELVFISFEIFDNPTTQLDSEAQKAVTEELLRLEAQITNRFIIGDLQREANIKFADYSVDLLSMIVPSENATEKEIKKIDKITVVRNPSGCRAQSPCDVQPILLILDEDVHLQSFLFLCYLTHIYNCFFFSIQNQPLKFVGNELYPWKIEATLADSSDPTAQLLAESSAQVDANGYVTFKNLGITKTVESFSLAYNFKPIEGIAEYLNLFFFFM
jgi:hypothetical protein